MHTLYFEDIQIGSVFRSSGRTATESDLTMFCMLSGDWNPLHCNREFAAQTRFGERVVPGLFGLSLITGAMSQWGVFEESALAMLNVRDWVFKAPIHLGDTITIEMLIESKRLTSSGESGIIIRKFSLVSQTGETLQAGYCDMMIRVRGDEVAKAQPQSS